MSRPIDILYVIPRPEIGGAERQLLLLIEGLDRDRFRPHVVCLDGGGSLLPQYADAVQGRIHVLHRARSSNLGVLRSLVRIMRAVQPTIVHTYLYIANLYGGIAARLAGVPGLIVSQRGLGIDPQHTWVKRAQIRALTPLIGQLADRLVANAHAVAVPMWRSGFDGHSTEIIYNGVPPVPPVPEDERMDLVRELDIEETDVLLGAVARIDPKKDLATMLRAVAKVVEGAPNVRLLIVGGGFPHYLNELRDLADELGIARRVDFLGFRTDPLGILSLCRISLLSSLTEGLPNAILESMRLGKPVVATRVGGVPELVDDGVHGHLVPVGDSGAFADRVLDLIAHPDRAARMGAEGRARALRDFSVETMVRRTEEVYEELLREVCGRPQERRPVAEPTSEVAPAEAHIRASQAKDGMPKPEGRHNVMPAKAGIQSHHAQSVSPVGIGSQRALE